MDRIQGSDKGMNRTPSISADKFRILEILSLLLYIPAFSWLVGLSVCWPFRFFKEDPLLSKLIGIVLLISLIIYFANKDIWEKL